MTCLDGTVIDFNSGGEAARDLKVRANLNSDYSNIQRRIASCLKKPGDKGYFSHYYGYKFLAI